MSQEGLETQRAADQATRRSAEEPDIEALVARAADNQEDAWADLVGMYSRRVYALARSRLRDQHVAEEITQAVFVSVFQYLTAGRYTASGKFEPWLFRIAMNRVRDHIRRTSRRPEHLDMTENITADQQSAWRKPDEIDTLREALLQLPAVDQEVIALRHQAGLEFKSIAEMLEEPVGTLLARHHRALGKLRKILNPAGTRENTA